MKIIEHSNLKLMIRDGAPWYTFFFLKNLLGSKWNTAIEMASALGVIVLGNAWRLGKIPADYLLATKAALALLSTLFILTFAIKKYRGTPVYAFDKATGELIIYQDESSKSYALSRIVNVIAVSKRCSSPPPVYWRTVCLELQSGERLELHPGHDQPEIQQEMVALIRNFLELNDI